MHSEELFRAAMNYSMPFEERLSYLIEADKKHFAQFSCHIELNNLSGVVWSQIDISVPRFKWRKVFDYKTIPVEVHHKLWQMPEDYFSVYIDRTTVHNSLWNLANINKVQQLINRLDSKYPAWYGVFECWGAKFPDPEVLYYLINRYVDYFM
jgi:hypothetical protein